MSALPSTLSALSHASQTFTFAQKRVLLAMILSTEEEMISITPLAYDTASRYKLHTAISDDGTVTLIAEPAS